MTSYTNDKILGSIVGAALGDALGAPYEFRCNRNRVYRGLLELVPEYRSEWQGIRKGHLGQFTDDTEMAITLMRGIIEDEGYYRENMILRYMKWANSKPFGMGKNTRKLLHGIKTIKGYYDREKKHDFSNAWSNGALMRSYPLAIFGFTPFDWEKAVEYDCSITNNNRMCVDIEKAYIYSVIETWNEENKGMDYSRFKDYVWEGIQRYINNKGFVYNLRDILYKNIRPNVTGSKGWVLRSLQATMYGLNIGQKGYKEGIDAVIKLGGDTDTNAAIAGALLGGYYGYYHIVDDPTTDRNLQVMEMEYERGYGKEPGSIEEYWPRPVEYTLHDRTELVDGMIRLYLKCSGREVS